MTDIAKGLSQNAFYIEAFVLWHFSHPKNYENKQKNESSTQSKSNKRNEWMNEKVSYSVASYSK